MRILIVDDDADLRHSLALLLSEAGHDVAAEGLPVEGLRRALAERFDLMLCDVRMPQMTGLEFVRKYNADGGAAPIIMMSAYGAEDAAIEAMRAGAYDYLSKPFRADEVLLTVRKAEERERLRSEVEELRSELGAELVRDVVVAESRQMRELLELAARVARHATTVLITGESGTGKEVVARAIHRMSPRSGERFIAINCAAIPENLLESELFGHVKGAFTGATADRVGLFESADGGTLLLDEIGDMPAGLQAKLLRVLEDGQVRRVGGRDDKPVDVRVIASTATPLEEAVDRGTFRADLFYRLDVVRLRIPPLRERPEDIPSLLTHYAQLAEQRLGRPVRLAPDAVDALARYAWPGNVRELRNAIERASVLGGDAPLGAAAFMLAVPIQAPVNGNGTHTTPAPMTAAERDSLDLKSHVADVERALIRRALERSHGSRREAADLLGVSLRTLFYKMRRHRLDRV